MSSPAFHVVAPFEPAGDQPHAIEVLTEGLARGERYQTLLGVTGSGKTMTLAHVIANYGKPTLVLSHNKTLAAQLYGELRQFLPDNAVEYFVSYYDYYQPEAYVPQTDVYIEKDASINADIESLRLRATSSLMEREDVVIVATVSAIYGLGDPAEYRRLLVTAERGEQKGRDQLLADLVRIQYGRNDVAFEQGTFRVRGDTVEIFPAYAEQAIRVEFFGDEVERITKIDPLTGRATAALDRCAVYPAKHFVTQRADHRTGGQADPGGTGGAAPAAASGGQVARGPAARIADHLRCGDDARGRHLCRNRELLAPLLGPPARESVPPACWTISRPSSWWWWTSRTSPCRRSAACINGDRARKETLVEYGFRLPSALDNRPLRFEEFMQIVPQLLAVSATPGELELQLSGGQRGRADHPADGPGRSRGPDPAGPGQVDDLLGEIRERAKRRERVLVTTLTKRMAEDLTDYLQQAGVRVRYLHSDIDAIERMEILRGLRLGDFDVLVGINLLREGLDLPEVSLVAILDADQEGFLRSDRSLIQTVGRAARNLHGRAILYADRMTGSMERALREMERRRQLQVAHNQAHGITPRSIIKSLEEVRLTTRVADARTEKPERRKDERLVELDFRDPAKRAQTLAALERQMREAAANLEFEVAAMLRDQINELRALDAPEVVRPVAPARRRA